LAMSPESIKPTLVMTSFPLGCDSVGADMLTQSVLTLDLVDLKSADTR
jgi:hypothetical protein